MNDKNDLTQGSITKTLIRFSLPLLFANIIQALYGAVDLMVIGQYCSAESVSAVSTGTQVTQIITSVITGMTLGGTILVGKYIGMKKPEEAKKAIGTTLTLFCRICCCFNSNYAACLRYDIKTFTDTGSRFCTGTYLCPYLQCGYFLHLRL